MQVSGIVARVREWDFTPKTGKDAGVKIVMLTLDLLEDTNQDRVIVEIRQRPGDVFEKGTNVLGVGKGHKVDNQGNIVYKLESLIVRGVVPLVVPGTVPNFAAPEQHAGASPSAVGARK